MFVPTYLQGNPLAFVEYVESKTPNYSLQVNRHDLTLMKDQYDSGSGSYYAYLALKSCRSSSPTEPVCQYYLTAQINQQWLYASYTKNTKDYFDHKMNHDGVIHFRSMDTVQHPFKELLILSVRSTPTGTQKTTLQWGQPFYLCFHNPLLHLLHGQMCLVGSDGKVTTDPTNCKLQIAS